MYFLLHFLPDISPKGISIVVLGVHSDIARQVRSPAGPSAGTDMEKYEIFFFLVGKGAKQITSPTSKGFAVVDS